MFKNLNFWEDFQWEHIFYNGQLVCKNIPNINNIYTFQISESFKGCMRSFYLNSKTVDLVNSKAVMGVRQCFSRFEPGVHFDGYGYAVFGKIVHQHCKWQICGWTYTLISTCWYLLGHVFSVLFREISRHYSDKSLSSTNTLQMANICLYLLYIQVYMLLGTELFGSLFI